LLYVWDYIYENGYHYDSATQFSPPSRITGKPTENEGQTDACEVGRGGIPRLQNVMNASMLARNATIVEYLKQKASILNHFLTSPVAAPPLAALTNTYHSLRRHVEWCWKDWSGHGMAGSLHGDKPLPEILNAPPPNFITVDFWSIDDPLSTVDRLTSEYFGS
jgi:hypothetical protein